MDSEELAVPLDLENFNENGVGADWRRLDSKALAAPVDSENINETTSKAYAWIP